ncbi:MAG: tripartite tricarboxylate transporter substrate-binding protein, partial [Burkholderiales bacterium]
FTPVTLLGDSPYFVVVHPSVPAQNIKELIAHARAHPGKLNYASAGNASLAHFAGALFQSRAKVELTHVPYKGSAPALIDLLAGRVEMQFGSIPPALPHMQAGKLRALAVTSARRISAAPSVPTVMESGLPDYEAVLWMAVLLPAGAPAGVVNTLNAASAMPCWRKVWSRAPPCRTYWERCCATSCRNGLSWHALLVFVSARGLISMP